MIKMIIKAITKEYHSKLIVRIDAPRKAKMKAWKMYLIESKTRTVPCFEDYERLLNPYLEKIMAVVKREIIPESPKN